MKIKIALVFHAALFYGTSFATANRYVLSRTFDDPTVTSEDLFGISVAIDGDRVVVGATFDDTNGSVTGQAHLFEATTGALLHTFDNPTNGSVDTFGQSVAIRDNYVLVAAPFDDTGGSNVGQVHLFNASSGLLLRTFTDPTPTVQDRFGTSIAIDGNHVAIGAIHDDTVYANAGQVHIFDATNGNLLRTFDDPIADNASFFGASVALNGDRVLIGASNDVVNGINVGQAFLFDLTTGSLLQTLQNPTPNSGDTFGRTVALNNDYVVVAAPFDDTLGDGVGQVHLFDATTGTLLHTLNDSSPTHGDLFGYSLALRGEHLIVGSPGDDTNGSNVGQAHLFDAASGNLLQTFNDPTISGVDAFGNTDFFGRSVGLDDDQILIGAPYDDTQGYRVGQVHLYTLIPEPTTLALDIKPGPSNNTVPLNGNGTLQMAILANADFDVLDINIGSLLFGDPILVDGGATALGATSDKLRDLNHDGLDDLLVGFSISDLVDGGALDASSVEGRLTGELFDGTSIIGSDIVRMVPQNNGGGGLVISTVPEPGSCVLALAALCLAMSRRRAF